MYWGEEDLLRRAEAFCIKGERDCFDGREAFCTEREEDVLRRGEAFLIIALIRAVVKTDSLRSSYTSYDPCVRG